jgi:polyisoprenyl-phosphate glycosyltransferase
MKISIVIPVFNEASNIPPLYAALVPQLESVSMDYEILFVDDGSTDGSVEETRKLRARNDRVRLLSLSRNFGHQIALTAGIDHASGDAIVLMDADLQHPPALIPQLISRWLDGFEVVHTIRKTTAESSWPKRATAAAFYRVFRLLSRVDLPSNAADFRLIDRKVADALRGIRERTRFLRGLTVWAGYRSTSISYDAPTRQAGETKYSPARMLKLAIDALVSFSAAPLHLAVYAGIVLALLGFLYAGYALYARFVTGHVLPGWTSLAILVSIVGGIQLVLMGVIGVYLGKIFEEVKRRPLYLVRSRLGIDVPRFESQEPAPVADDGV